MRDRTRELHQILRRSTGHARVPGAPSPAEVTTTPTTSASRRRRFKVTGRLANTTSRGTTTQAVASTTWHPGDASPCWSVALALVGAPAIALRAFCVGKSCADEGPAADAVPFCPLPKDLRAEIEAGYRQGRSPDVMAAAQGRVSRTKGESRGRTTRIPRLNSVPIVFFGRGVRPGRLPDGVGVDRIAPTIAELIGFDRSRAMCAPGPRCGTRVSAPVPARDRDRVAGRGRRVVLPLRHTLGHHLPRRRGVDHEWTTGSLPVDPAAVLTTIGTGGLPWQHGITGTLVRDAHGQAVRAWSADAPTSIIATLPDDWDHATTQGSRIGLVAADAVDQGLVGGTWYIDHDRDDVLTGPGDPVAAVARLIATGYGSDDTTDILGVVLHGSPDHMDRQTRSIVTAVQRSVADATFVLTSTGAANGSLDTNPPDVVSSVDRAVGGPVVSAIVPGGLFLDQQVMAANDITSDDVVRAMDALTAPNGDPLFADAYPGFAVSFSRYC